MRSATEKRLHERLADGVRSLAPLIRRVDRHLAAAFAVAAIATVLFAALMDEVHENDVMVRTDRAASRWVADWRGDGLTGLMRVATMLADPWFVVVLVALAACFLLVRRRRGAALFLVVSTVGTALLVLIAKLVIARPRPGLPVALIHANGYAFPSGHAAQSLALYGAFAVIVAVIVRDPRWRILACASSLMVAFVVGISRVVLGAHWLSDVVAGWALAAGWLAALLTGRRALMLHDPGRRS